MKHDSERNLQYLLIGLLICLGLLRLLSLGLYPLGDTTEARYAEIARLMVSSDNWITPQIESGRPFWAKPPLSTWLSAFSFKVLGLHEFAARLPSFLLAATIVALVFSWAKKIQGTTYGLASALVLSTSAVFFISSGAVMTDPALLLGTTLSMVAFYRAVDSQPSANQGWGYLFFLGLVISLLAKGPVGVVLTFLPVGAWFLIHRNWQQVWQGLPWFGGTLLTVALGIPWYLLAEQQTPGFLEYFLIGEHWKRFVEGGWQGDLYGNAHSRPMGTIWIYWLLAAIPWSFMTLATFFKRHSRHRFLAVLKGNPKLTSYLLVWTFAPIVFFSLAGNILWTYVLPGMPAFAMLIATQWAQNPSNGTHEGAQSVHTSQVLPRVGSGMTILFAIILLIMTSSLVPQRSCQKSLIATARALSTPETQLVYLFKRPHSAQFYSAGEALLLEDPLAAESYLADNKQDFFVVRTKDLSKLPQQLSSDLENLGEHNGYYLLREILKPPPKS